MKVKGYHSERIPQRKDKHVRIRLDLCEWTEEEVKKRRFWCFSHAVEVALTKLRESEKALPKESDD